jgi:hypothetical protein
MKNAHQENQAKNGARNEDAWKKSYDACVAAKPEVAAPPHCGRSALMEQP